MIRAFLRIFFGIATYLLVAQVVCLAQSPEPPEAEAELQRADALISDSEYDQSIAILESLSTRYPGTSIDARATMNRAYIQGAVRRDVAAASLLYQDVMTRFPNTFIGYVAESNLADIELMREPDAGLGTPAFQAYLSRVRELVLRAGGPDIALDDFSEAVRPVPGLSAEEQELILEDLLVLVADRMRVRAALSVPLDLIAYKRATRIKIFAINRFSDHGLNSEELGNLRARGLKLLGLQDSQQLLDFTPPVITVQSPADGSVLTDSRPTLRFTLTDGDAEDPARHRAWCLLAALLGQLEPNAASSNAPEPAFLQWLVDPDDPSSTAFWELLACARRSGGLRRQPLTAGEAASASEAA